MNSLSSIRDAEIKLEALQQMLDQLELEAWTQSSNLKPQTSLTFTYKTKKMKNAEIKFETLPQNIHQIELEYWSSSLNLEAF